MATFFSEISVPLLFSEYAQQNSFFPSIEREVSPIRVKKLLKNSEGKIVVVPKSGGVGSPGEKAHVAGTSKCGANPDLGHVPSEDQTEEK